MWKLLTWEPLPPLLPKLSSLFSELVSSCRSFTHGPHLPASMPLLSPLAQLCPPLQPGKSLSSSEVLSQSLHSQTYTAPPHRAWGLTLGLRAWSKAGGSSCVALEHPSVLHPLVAPSRVDSQVHPPLCVRKERGETPAFPENLLCTRHHTWHSYIQSLIESLHLS